MAIDLDALADVIKLSVENRSHDDFRDYFTAQAEAVAEWLKENNG